MGRTRVRWGRVAALAIGAVLTCNLVAARAGAGGSERAASRVYVVKAGDTIWDIARRQVGPEGDPRPLVERLIRVNDLRDALIAPGQRLVLSS